MSRSDKCWLQCHANSMPQIAGTYPNVSNVLADASQNNFVQHQQQQQPQQQQIHQAQFPRQQNHPYNHPIQVSTFERGFAMNPPAGNYVANAPYQDPYPFNPAQLQMPPLLQNYPYPNQNPMNPIVPNIGPIFNSPLQGPAAVDLRSYVPTQPSPIFILPSNPVVQVPPQNPPCPNTRSGVCGTQFCCSPTPAPPYIPYPCPLPYPASFCYPGGCREPNPNTPFCKETLACACCPKRPELSCEHRCEPTADAICNKPNCPASISLQALASQLLSIPGVISCASTRLILRRVPGSNIRNSTEETVERARKTINTLTQEQLLTETRNAQQINALINLHMAANPPANIIPLLTTVQLKVNVLKSQLETIINHRITENQAAGAETCVGLNSAILGLKSDQELRTLLATLRQKECDQRANFNFAAYHSQRVIAETRLKNIEDKIALVEAEIERRRCACLPPTLRQTGMTCQDSRRTVWHAYPGTMPPSSFGNFNYNSQSGGWPPSRESPDPFCLEKKSPRRLNVSHVGSPETTYRKPPTLVKDSSGKRFSDEDCDCDNSTDEKNSSNKNGGTSNDCDDADDDGEGRDRCTCDKSTDDESEGKKKLQINQSEAGPSGGTKIEGRLKKNVDFQIKNGADFYGNESAGEMIDLIDEREDNYGKIEESLDCSSQLKACSSCSNNDNSNKEIKIARQEFQDKLLLQLSSAAGSHNPSNKKNHEKKEEITVTSGGNKYANPFSSRDPSASGLENENESEGGVGLDKFISGALSVISGFSNHVASFGTIIGDKITALRSHLAPEISHPLFSSIPANSPSTCSNNDDIPRYWGCKNPNTLPINNNTTRNDDDNNYYGDKSSLMMFGKLKTRKVRRLNFDGSREEEKFDTRAELFVEFNSNGKLSRVKNIIIQDKTIEKSYILMRPTFNTHNNPGDCYYDNKLKFYKDDKTLLIRSRLKNSQSMSSRIQFMPFSAVPKKFLDENAPTVEIRGKLVARAVNIEARGSFTTKELKLTNFNCDRNRLKSRKFKSLTRVEKFREIKVLGEENGGENETEINYEYEVTLPENSRSFRTGSSKSSASCWSRSSENSGDQIPGLKLESFYFRSIENQMEASSELIVAVHD